VAGGTSGSPATVWELGMPTSTGFDGPLAAFSGDNCVGTNLSALYGPDAAVTLTSPAIDVPTGAATLRFRQVVEIDGPNAPVGGGADFGTLRVLDASDDSELAVLEAQVQGGSSGNWKLYSAAMPAALLGMSVKLEFGLHSDSAAGSPDSFELAGWYIDDVELLAK
jgi:hypothetical protein